MRGLQSGGGVFQAGFAVERGEAAGVYGAENGESPELSEGLQMREIKPQKICKNCRFFSESTFFPAKVFGICVFKNMVRPNETCGYFQEKLNFQEKIKGRERWKCFIKKLKALF